MVRKHLVKIDKKDYLRALLTDTIPSDTPIIFSNDGLYINSKRTILNQGTTYNSIIKKLTNNIITPEKRKSQSHPHKYKIRKDDINLRTLFLLHPRAQINIAEFYKEWSESITYLCSSSPISIRAPIKIGNSFYSKTPQKPKNKYKEINIDTLDSELINRHASSFFSYRGINRKHKFFSEKNFIDLEKQFPIMWLMDITNCFPSIYTHSISWAIKNKEYIKKHVKHSNQFCQTFDTLMQRCNNNETNGIPVGPEISRIFAEIILQSIDTKIVNSLNNNHSYTLNVDYSISRYVDDYIIFSKNSEIMKIVSNTITDTIGEYNLHINERKSEKYSRPFCTEKSNIVNGLDEIIRNLEENLFENKIEQEKNNLICKKIYNRHKFVHAFIKKTKRLCSLGNNTYSDISAYLISVCYKRIIHLIDNIRYNKKSQDNEHAINIRTAISILIEIMFFFYSVHPTIAASNQLAKTIIIVDTFIKDNYPQYLEFIRTEIMDNTNLLSLDRTTKDNREGYISLERLNILLATSEFGKNHLVPSNYFSSLLSDIKTLSYFNIISLLYYFKDHAEYHSLVEQLEDITNSKLDKDFDLQKNSENAHLLLDLLSCPYISIEFRKNLLKRFYSKYLPNEQLSSQKQEEDIDALNQTYWFVKWENLDLLKLLERKELNSAY